MKLNRLFLQGFKSFAAPTEFLFSDGFTGVVGPNGCGKSNIVDSIKWVLGDRSAKSLRGEEMLDVIFNGGNGSPAANFAEVSLSFGNNDKTLPMDYDEITITRRLYRTGESEYYINNQICRLKDIRELFMDTGVGMESYSIIEQGKVDFVLKASPTERRGLFEEAAGISKYKSKKKEAESKLDKVQQDLLRLSDTTREIKSQIRSIKIQATKAQKYRQIAEEIKLKKVNYFLHQYHQFITQKNEVTGLRTGLTQEIESLKAQINAIEDGIINFEKEIIAVDNQSRQEQNTLMAISSDISSVTTEIENNKVRREEVIEEESKAKKQLATLTQQAISTRQTICETMHLLEVTKQEYETLSAKILEQETLLQELVKEEKDLNANLDAKRNEVFDNTHKKSQYQNELTEIQNELKNLSQRRDRCQARQSEITAELNKLNETVVVLNSGITDTQSQREQLKNELINLEQLLKSLKDDLTVLNGKIAQIQEEAHKKMARKEILEDLERHKEGLSTGVKEVLEAIRTAKTESPETQNKLSSVSIHGLLADLIKVDSKYVLAIEAALDNIAQAIVTNSFSDSSKIIGYVKDLRKGKVITIATDAIKDNFDLYPSLPNLPGVLGKASQVVQTSKEFEPIVEWLLGAYILVENLEVALAVQANNQTFRPIVTLTGESITAEGIISGGGNEPGISILSRKTELNSLIEDLKSISENLKILQEQKVAKNSECLELDGKCQHCRQDIYVQEINLLDKKKSLEEIQRRQELLNKEQEISRLETTETTNQINSLAERATSIAEVIKQIETRLVEVQQNIEELSKHLNDYNERKKAAAQTMTDTKISLTSASEKKEYLTSSISQLNSQVEQIEISLKTTSDGVTESQAKLKAIETAQADAETKLQTLSGERNKVEAVLNELNQKIEQLRNDLNNKKIEQNKAIQDVQIKDGDLKRIELQEQESTLKIDNLTERAKEETGNVLAEAYQTYTDDPNLNWEEIGRQIQEMRDKLGTMTDINLSAIDQLKELEERLALYDTQEQDLVKSKHSLQELIRKMNRESREKFQQVFNQIQENFNTVFRKLFGGGKAELILCKVKESHHEAPAAVEGQAEQASGTDSAEAQVAPLETAEAEVISADSLDVLEAGVEIIAKPPGKEPTSISLLSGGEKTLTAFAMTMAIFQLHPSPFCILDEADAALDESNVNRFIALLRDYTSHTQFIIISHNKKTMVTMDRLYGLTLQKSGMSKKISVKMAAEESQEKPELVGAAN